MTGRALGRLVVIWFAFGFISYELHHHGASEGVAVVFSAGLMILVNALWRRHQHEQLLREQREKIEEEERTRIAVRVMIARELAPPLPTAEVPHKEVA